MNMRLLQNLVAVIIDTCITVMNDETARQHQFVKLVAPVLREVLDKLNEPPTTGLLGSSQNRILSLWNTEHAPYIK